MDICAHTKAHARTATTVAGADDPDRDRQLDAHAALSLLPRNWGHLPNCLRRGRGVPVWKCLPQCSCWRSSSAQLFEQAGQCPAAMTHPVLFRRVQLSHGAAIFRKPEMGVVTKTILALGSGDDPFMSAPFGHQWTRIVGGIHVDENGNIEGAVVLNSEKLADQALIVRLIGFFPPDEAGIASRVYARCAAQGRYTKAGVVGQGRPTSMQAGVARLGNGVLHKSGVWFFCFGNTQLVLRNHANAGLLQNGRKLTQLARISGSKYHFAQGT